ncbi:hypothetical protein [Lapillicoccus sp.]|uniref:hypothetical protein n=1 Tax=Lapillicoccus sp. TaxID=1909287 RepID=UPI0025DE2FC8|nr:hypothetical protein [Lapillicoccus sp.]
MSRLHSALLGTIAWALVVLTCATGVWFVIDRVGRDVLSPAPVAREAREAREAQEAREARAAPTGVPGTAYRTGTPTTTSPAPSPTPPTPATSPTATPMTKPSGSATPSTPAPRHTTTVPAPVPAPVPPPPPSAPSPPPTSAPPASTSDAVAVTGGRVGATCTGGQISLGFATPESGWSFSVETESDQVGVHFLATSGNGETSVSARCVNGAPVFTTSETGD